MTNAKNAQITVAGAPRATTSATTINVVNDGKVTTITGYNNFESKQYTAKAAVAGSAPGVTPVVEHVDGVYILVTANGTDKPVKAVYVLSAAPAKAPEVYGYYTGKIGDVTADGTYYTFYVNGAAESYLQQAAPGEAGIYTVTETPAGVEIGNATGVVAPVKVTAAEEGYFTTTAGGYYYLTDDCKVYNATQNPPPGGRGEETELVLGDEDVYVTFVSEVDPVTHLNMVKVVYIVDALPS